MMRRSIAIIKATALEVLSEPLVFLVTITAMALAVFAPAMHYHDFGEPSRMARDAGASALLVGGLITAAFGALKTMRREIESQTAFSALALPVSRRLFFLSKTAGVFVSYLVFVVTVGAVSLAAVRASVIGGEIAARECTSVRMFGPIYALSVASVVLPFLYGAVVNRFLRKRFTIHANLCALVLALVAAGGWFDSALFLKILPLYALVATPALVLMCASAAFSTRFKFNVASTLAVIVFALFLPALGSYCLTDVLSAGEKIPWSYSGFALAAIAPMIAALLYVGIKSIESLNESH